MVDERVVTACDTIERLVTLDLSLRGTIISEYHRAAKNLYGESPILLAARRLKEQVNSGDTVVIVTGTVVGPSFMPRGETDGPAGAAVLARALRLGLGGIPIVVVDKHAGQGTEAIMTAAGFITTSPENLSQLRSQSGTSASRMMATTVYEFPPNDEKSRDLAESIFRDFSPSAIIATEKIGRNKRGRYHSTWGFDISDKIGRAEYLFEKAKLNGKLTIGIGDVGNEIGFGAIEDVVRQVHWYGRTCQCPCQGGIASSVATDVIIPAEVSNWGAYALAAALLLIAGKPQLIHDTELDSKLLEATAQAGFIHLGSEVAPSVDSFPLSTNLYVAGLIRDTAQYLDRFGRTGLRRGSPEKE